MIYLAKNKKGALERIQVVFIQNRITSQRAWWGAYNMDGTVNIIPCIFPNIESVLHRLMERYQDVRLSKRRMDDSNCHIVCLNQKFNLYDNNGVHLADLEGRGWRFCDGALTRRDMPYPEFPDYYDQIEVIHKDRLWVAMDIDTGRWVCFQKDGTEVSTHDVKETCIQDAIRRLS